MRLTDEELRDVLARAEEIQRASRSGDEWNAEVAAVVDAAEAVGLSRDAVERAIQERVAVAPIRPEAGTLAWAKSTDGKFYIAEVLASSDSESSVRFLRGSEHRVPLGELRPFALLPGQKVECIWPWWGPWTSTVVAYDSEKERVKLSDGWGTIKWFSLSDVWMAVPKDRVAAARTRMYLTLVGAGAVVSAGLGALVTWFVMR